jgi:hypothetical protein
MGAVAQIVEKGRKTIDGWINALTGANIAGVDARMASMVMWMPMSEQESAHLYAGDAMAAKIVDKPVDEATKRGYKWLGLEDEDEKALTQALCAVRFNEKMQEAWKKARLCGGAGVLKLYDDDLKLDQPMKEGVPIKSLLVFSRFELRVDWEDCNKDILSPRFGKPVFYTFEGRQASLADRTQMKIHHSRIVRFDGAWLPENLMSYTSQWGDSVLNRPRHAIRNFAHAHDAVNMAIKDLSVAVFKVKGLGEMLMGNDDEVITKRLQAVNLSKSIARAVIVDADGEDYDYRTRNLAGATDLVDDAEDRLVAETDIPKTVLMGGSPTGGLGQSGNHESENWYSYIESEQTNYYKPLMLQVAREKCAELGIDCEELDVEFTKLWQLSDKEIADVRNIMAQADQKYHDMGVLTSDEIAEARFGNPKYSLETQIDMAERERQSAPDFEPPTPGAPDTSKVPPEMLNAAESVQSQALNGAQVTSLVQIAQMNQANQLDPNAARGILRAAFPSLSDDQLSVILTKSASVQPAPAPTNGGF